MPIGDSPIFTASFIPTPNIKIGIIRGMINIGNKIFPLLAPNINADPINPIKEIAKPPIDILTINHGKYFNSMLNKIAIGLGFQTTVVPELVHTSLTLVRKKVDFETFKKEIIETFYTK